MGVSMRLFGGGTRRVFVGFVLGVFVSLAAVAAPRGLPGDVKAALDKAKVPHDAMSVVVQEAGANAARVSWQSDRPMNPASLMKLLTTDAALDLLGPAWAWTTPVWIQGTVRNPGPQGVLDGDLVIKGTGDPKLVVERIWLLLRRVQQLGVHEIRGDIVLDRSAFKPGEQSPADFDGDASRPYNVQADALLLNYRSLIVTFTPDIPRGVAIVSVEPPMAGVHADTTVPLVSGKCDDWRGLLKAELADPARVHFAGAYPVACGEEQWPMAYADPKTYNERLLAGLWREMGGVLAGSVKDRPSPTSLPSFVLTSPTLAEVIRDINKFSNNTMAQQLFLTLALTQRGLGTPEAARDVLGQWAATKFGASATLGLVIDNGSGLSRDTRVSADLFARLLQSAWASPVMPELASSLPVVGVDGTLKKLQANAGRAHLKSGSLRDVVGIAGYVLSNGGRRYVLVAIVNHPNANAARPALEALLKWTASDGRAETRNSD
jgi:D-alanyl-D-alanine carboxypeptidase/D-alanyl-D-alanine-endopeptidase (penicillin-binding protein 4)